MTKVLEVVIVAAIAFTIFRRNEKWAWYLLRSFPALTAVILLLEGPPGEIELDLAAIVAIVFQGVYVNIYICWETRRSAT